MVRSETRRSLGTAGVGDIRTSFLLCVCVSLTEKKNSRFASLAVGSGGRPFSCVSVCVVFAVVCEEKKANVQQRGCAIPMRALSFRIEKGGGGGGGGGETCASQKDENKERERIVPTVAAYENNWRWR